MGRNVFNSIELRKPKRSMFDMSHERRLTTRMGTIVPIFCEETLPNDTWRLSTEIHLTFAPLLAPIKHAVNLTLHGFFVPNRIIWPDFKDFITNGRLGTETPPVPPYFLITNVLAQNNDLLDVGSLADHLGVGTITDLSIGWTTERLNAMPFLCYGRIWWEYYRDRNLTGDAAILDGAPSGELTGGDWIPMLSKHPRAWSADYFTTASISPQRGDDVLLPIENTGSVTYLSSSALKTAGGALSSGNTMIGTNTGSDGVLQVNKTAVGTGGTPGRVENIDDVNVTSEITVNSFRMALRLQQWLERQNVAGSRYNETIPAHFGRKTSDSTVQRPIYLGGMKLRVKIGEVFTTAYSEDADTNLVPPGNMAGYGQALGGKNLFTYNCEEWGFIMVLLSIMPTPAYMNGTRRMFFARRSFLDYPWPTFANLGEQEIYYNEFDTTSTTWPGEGEIPITDAFGYQSRYADWKYIPSTTHGEFKTTLDYWHLARKFSATPVLNAQFMYFEDELQDRIFAVAESDTCWIYLYNRCSVIRSLPYYGTPI